MTSLKQIQNTPSRTSLNAMYVYVTCVCVCVRGWVIVNFLWCLCLFACENAHQTAVANVFWRAVLQLFKACQSLSGTMISMQTVKLFGTKHTHAHTDSHTHMQAQRPSCFC